MSEEAIHPIYLFFFLLSFSFGPSIRGRLAVDKKLVNAIITRVIDAVWSTVCFIGWQLTTQNEQPRP